MTRSILISGGSRGIGRACALHLARAEAAHLVLLGRDAGALADTALAVGAAGGTADVFVANVTERTRLAEVAHGLVWLLDPADTMQVDQCLNRDGA